MNTSHWNESAAHLLERWIQLYKEKTFLIGETDSLNMLKEEVDGMDKEKFLSIVERHLQKVYDELEKERTEYNMSNIEYTMVTFLSNDYPEYIKKRQSNMKQLQQLTSIHRSVTELFGKKLSSEADMVAFRNDFFQLTEKHANTPLLKEIKESWNAYLPAFVDFQKKHEHVKQATATVLEEDKSLKQEWHQLSKNKVVTKQKATAFRTKQHELNESIRKATTAQKQLLELHWPDVRSQFDALQEKMSGSLSTVRQETERSMEVISQNDANEHAKLKQSLTDLHAVHKVDAHQTWLAAFIKKSRPFFNELSEDTKATRCRELWNRIYGMYKGIAVNEFIVTYEEFLALQPLNSIKSTEMPKPLARLKVDIEPVTLPSYADFPVLKKQQASRRTFPILIGAAIVLVLLLTIVYINRDNQTAETNSDIKETTSTKSLRNEEPKPDEVSKTELENFFISYKAAYFSSLNSGDFNAMAPYIDSNQPVYKQLKSYITSLTGKNVSFANDQFLVTKTESHDDGTYSIYTNEVYTFTDSYDASTQFKKERIYHVKAADKDKLQITKIDTLTDEQKPVEE
ncbi:TcaA NTF2-like domain-containing protein [Priestia aryabhattai]|uniref:TcaA NTF2-like domain-containing protein n=1 Tax=Priestia aryabhattai TaxID=412384 RepID=UPI0032E86916